MTALKYLLFDFSPFSTFFNMDFKQFLLSFFSSYSLIFSGSYKIQYLLILVKFQKKII